VFVRGDFGERGFLRGQHQLVDRLLLRRKLAVDRPGAGDVAGVAVDFATGVDQHQVAVLEQRVILLVMQDAAVAPGRDDRAVGRHLRPALAELVIQLGFQAVFVQPGRLACMARTWACAEIRAASRITFTSAADLYRRMSCSR
jgi:hypothetical protein